MFNKREQPKIKINSKTSDLDINSMPSDFYGGKNPVVEFKEEKKEINLNKYKITQPTEAEKKDFNKKQSASLTKATHPANLLTNSKFLLLVAGVIFVVALIGGSIYFWLTTRSNQSTNNNEVTNTTSSITNDITSTPIVTTSISTSSTPNNAQTATSTLLLTDTITFPSILLGYGQDYDSDKLFDSEEALLGSDPSIIDSDKDSHLDGHEVYYLYNPIGLEPNRLIDSGKVTEYTNPTYNYKIYYPKSWTYGSIDSQNKQMLFTALNGESVEVRVFDLSDGEDFNIWFSKYASKEHLSDLTDFESVFMQKGQVRKDKLVYYFKDDNRIYLILYRAGSNNQVNYRQIMEMMARSFRTSGNSYIKSWALNSIASSTVSITSSTTQTISSTISDFTSSNSSSTASTSTE